MYLGDIEVFRTSTAEPTTDGIVWTYTKEMSQYRSLWMEPQKLIFDLDNLINDKYTGSFNATLTAYFSRGQKTKTADLILPISAQKSASDSASAFTVPADDATVFHRVPSAVSRAIVSISACGQDEEEFWWSNVFSSDTYAFNSTVGELYGYSPFREIQVHIDGILAGVVWPFPIIFTGGVAPGFWRPIVGIDAFDLRQPEIDISPFLPLLTDGRDHSFAIKIVGLDVAEDGTATISNSVGSNWVVTGAVFLYLGEDSSYTARDTSMAAPEVIAPAPKITTMRNLIKNETGGNVSLIYSVIAERELAITSSSFSWNQTLLYSNFGLFNQEGYSQKNKQLTSGQSSIANLKTKRSNEVSFEYPLLVNNTYGSTGSGLTIDAWMNRGLDIEATGVDGISTFTFTSGPSKLHTKQWGKARYESTKAGDSTSSGDSTDVFRSEAEGERYHRSVKAINGTVVFDTDPSPRTALQPASQSALGPLGRGSVRSMLGRGPADSQD